MNDPLEFEYGHSLRDYDGVTHLTHNQARLYECLATKCDLDDYAEGYINAVRNMQQPIL